MEKGEGKVMTKFDYNAFKKSFKKIAKAINKNNYTYSNEILYAACGGVSILPPQTATQADIDKLSSVMLLVGRAYAASPERRKGAKSVNDGMITFFKAIAKSIVAHSDYDGWRNRVISIAKYKYDYNGKQSDYDLLIESKDCVLSLNKMLREAIRDFDKSVLGDIKNCISFCTKLLHFIVPHIFYIKDSISWDAIWSIYGRQSDSTLKYGNNPQLDIPQYLFGDELNTRYPLFKAERGKGDLHNTPEKEYWYLCCGCYAVSCVLKDIKLISQTKGFNGIPNIYSLPRLVDSVLLNIHH